MATKKRHKKGIAKQGFTPKTRLFDLVNKKYHLDLRLLVEEICPWLLIDGKESDWIHLRRLEVDYSKICKDNFLLVLTNFLNRIGRGDGLNCRMEVLIKYLASPEHSNFGMKFESLNPTLTL